MILGIFIILVLFLKRLKNENKINWMRIGLIAGSLMVAYFLFVKKGKVEVPKVEVPEV